MPDRYAYGWMYDGVANDSDIEGRCKTVDYAAMMLRLQHPRMKKPGIDPFIIDLETDRHISFCY